MKVTIPIKIRKYVPGPAVPSRLLAVHDDRHNADFLGVEYTDGSLKVPYYNDGESDLIYLINNGEINMMRDDEGNYTPEMSNLVYEEIKDYYNFILCEYSVGKDESDEESVLWYDLEIDSAHFVDQKRLFGETPEEVFMNPENAIIFDDTPLVASIETFGESKVLCVTKNGRKYVLFNDDNEAVQCTENNVKMIANSCSEYGIEGGSLPDVNYYAKYSFRIRSCSVVEGVVNGEGRLNVTISGMEWNAFFDIQATGAFELPATSLTFSEA